MRRIISILLVILFVYDNVGFVVAFKILQVEAKHNIKTAIISNLNSSELEVIIPGKLRRKSIIWLEEDREFRLEGRLYDVVRKSGTGTETVYYCINDKKEESIFVNLEKRINDFISNHSGQADIIKMVIKKLANSIFILKCFDLIFEKLNSCINCKISGQYSPFYMEIPSPPPRFSC